MEVHIGAGADTTGQVLQHRDTGTPESKLLRVRVRAKMDDG